MSDEHEPLSLKSKHLWEVARASANPAMWAMLDDLEMLQAERAKLMQRIAELESQAAVSEVAVHNFKIRIDELEAHQRIVLAAYTDYLERLSDE
jgi:hypothetical protein